ncbi:MAG TPA: sigma 54-interacting transcriptional regulator [Halanaerobiales bacterium]|nr:sigma 54-interacting transcriptional regulator [Halanaerobiales bacterium]
MIGSKAERLFNNIPFEEVLLTGNPIQERIVKVDKTDIVLSVNPIKNLGDIYGAVAIIKKFSDTEKRQQKLRAQLIHKGHFTKYTFPDISGKSKKLNKCKKIAKRMAKAESTILLTGESGTGKELFAQAIHNDSNRKKSQFVAVNCAALPESLLESKLFGYAEGAFTGAKKEVKPGLFELAHNGTLLLDEIGEIPLELQARLLRILEEREIMRIGGERVINVDVRIITASNRDLYELMQENKF